MGFSCFFQSVSRRKQAKPVVPTGQNFFLRNGALLLEKQITFGSVNKADPIKIFTAKEIQLAITNQMLSQGAFGPLYKGFLDDQTVAIQQYSKNQTFIRDENQLIDLILNMVVIQSQISHRNIVKIIGCCLETPIPSVVYEFVPNGSLSSHIFGNQTAPLSWVRRLSVATQIAEALCYLHIAGSRCIIHRDLKSGSILLDQHFNPKIANFELSITTTVDQRTVEDAVIGTTGHSAPEYISTGKFTEMIDVYAFGWILLEIFTGKTVSSIYRFANVALHDVNQPSIIDETCVRALLEKGNLEGVEMGQLKAAAELVVRCLRRKGEERPSMKEVVQEMHKIIKWKDDCC